VIEIRGIRKAFAGVEILRGVDLSIGAGEIVALIGRSGCGKTTLLRCINFLEDYDAGEIRLDGELLWYRQQGQEARRRLAERELAQQRQRMGVVFQQYNLFPHMTALENVCLGPRFGQRLASEEADSRGRDLLARVGLSDRLHAYPALIPPSLLFSVFSFVNTCHLSNAGPCCGRQAGSHAHAEAR